MIKRGSKKIQDQDQEIKDQDGKIKQRTHGGNCTMHDNRIQAVFNLQKLHDSFPAVSGAGGDHLQIEVQGPSSRKFEIEGVPSFSNIQLDTMRKLNVFDILPCTQSS